MRAFWWFKENSIAGMARPGFNSAHWFDLPFEEAVLVGWLGQYSSGTADILSLTHHLETYVPKIYKFYQLDEFSGSKRLQSLRSLDGIIEVIERVNRRLNIWKAFSISATKIQFEMNDELISQEINFLKQNQIQNVITLTEKHHQKDLLDSHFNTHHISIADLGAPTLDQAHVLADIVTRSAQRQERIAVHCLAGIGRTSTMLIAAHILLGETYDSLEILIKRQNPSFSLSGPQTDFLRSINSK